jgi:hypothetical protein
VVVSEDVVGMSDPETSWSLISVKQRPRPLGLHNQVAFDQVVGFGSIFNENGVTHGVVRNIVLNGEIVDSVESDGSVVSLMDGITLSIRVVDSPDHMEMNGVTTKLEGLTYIGEFAVFDFTNQRLVSG